MKEFEVEITETYQKTITTVADTKEEAEAIVKEQWRKGIQVLDVEDFIEIKFSTVNEKVVDQQLNVLRVEPGKEPEEVVIGNDLEDLQEAIGGQIEVAYYYEDPVVILCDEEGKIKGRPLNRAIREEDGEVKDIIAGTFLICGAGEDDFESLPRELMDKYKERFQTPEEFYCLGGKMIVCPAEQSGNKMSEIKPLNPER